jgi:hypothetical protein
MIRTTQAQLREIRDALQKSNVNRNEKVWTFLVACLFDRASLQSKMIERLCGEPLKMPQDAEIWFEAEPIPPRKGTKGNAEGNTKLDLAFGHVARRGTTAAGITYGPQKEGSWVCFVEAKCLSDCSTTVSYDPLRNQLARVIENLLCFQAERNFPERIFFTLLTPRLFLEKENKNARLYGYKMSEYRENPERILADINQCKIEWRPGFGPEHLDLRTRLAALHLNWVSYEDLLEPEMGADLDIVREPELVHGLKDTIMNTIARLLPSPQEVTDCGPPTQI